MGDMDMAISTTRRATADDNAAVRAAAERFCQRHSIAYDAEFDAETAINYAIETSGPQGGVNARLRKLWTACYCRALRVPCDVRTTMAYGHVGLHVD